MLIKNPNDRLGSGPNDAEDVLSHPFFADINISDLLAKKMKAEYVPLTEFEYVSNNGDAEDPETYANDNVDPHKSELIKKLEECFG